MKICKIEDCNNTIFKKNYCTKHYMQLKKYNQILNRTIFDKNEIIIYDYYAEILLYNNKHEEVGRTIINLDNIEMAKSYKWRLKHKDNYAVSSHNNKTIFLHRLIVGAKEDDIVDHCDRNRLNNLKSNLRICTKKENATNNTIRKDNTSGIIGVHWHKRICKWSAVIRINNKTVSLGYYNDINEATKVRLIAEKKYYGELFAPQRHLFQQYEIK